MGSSPVPQCEAAPPAASPSCACVTSVFPLWGHDVHLLEVSTARFQDVFIKSQLRFIPSALMLLGFPDTENKGQHVAGPVHLHGHQAPSMVPMHGLHAREYEVMMGSDLGLAGLAPWSPGLTEFLVTF